VFATVENDEALAFPAEMSIKLVRTLFVWYPTHERCGHGWRRRARRRERALRVDEMIWLVESGVTVGKTLPPLTVVLPIAPEGPTIVTHFCSASFIGSWPGRSFV